MRSSTNSRVVFLSIWALIGVSNLQAQSTEVQQIFQHGATALHEGRAAEAESDFRHVIRLDPNLAEAHLDLGLVLGREGKLTEATESIRKALDLNAHIDSAHLFLGIFLYQSGQSDPAIEALRQELALNPKNAEALSWLGIVELAAGHPELATSPLDAALAVRPNDLNLLEYDAKAHSQVAQASYSRMATIDPDAWQVHKVRAELFLADSKDKEAIAEYEAALTHETRNPDLYEGVGDAYRHMNELEQAKKAYTRELDLSPHNPIAMYNLGSTEVDLGNYAAGIPLLRAMLNIYKASPQASYYLGRGLAESGKDAEAAAIFEQTAKSNSEGEIGKRSYYELSRIYRRLHKPEDSNRALAEYNRLRQRDDKQKAEKVADWRKFDGMK